MNWKDEIAKESLIVAEREADEAPEILNAPSLTIGFHYGANWMLEKLQPYIDYYKHMNTNRLDGIEAWDNKYIKLVKQIEELEK